MHELITIVVRAECPEDATNIAVTTFHSDSGGLYRVYEYGRKMTDKTARFRDSVPEVVRETGAIRADTEDGLKLIESMWEATRGQQERSMAIIREAMNRYDNKQLLTDPYIEDVEVDPHQTFFGEVDTVGGYPLAHMKRVGAYQSTILCLYRERGMGIRDQDGYDRLISDIEENSDGADMNLYAVPVDVHH